MIDTIMHFLRELPFWAWILVPAFLMAFLSYFITGYNLKKTFLVLLITLGALSAVTSFHFWEVYLSNHFLGSFDQQGLPHQGSANGWHFFFAAWPLWLLPSIIIYSLARLIEYALRYKKGDHHAITTTETSEQVQQKLLMEQLKTSLKESQDKLNQLGLDIDEPLPENAADLLKFEDEYIGLKADLAAKDNLIKQLDEQIKKQKDRTHQIIESAKRLFE